MSGAGSGEFRAPTGVKRRGGLGIGWVDGVGGHEGGPFGPFAIANHDGDGAAQGFAVAHAAEYGHRVGFEFHAGASTIAESAASQLGSYVRRGKRHPAWHVFHHGDKCLSVGFS